MITRAQSYEKDHYFYSESVKGTEYDMDEIDVILKEKTTKETDYLLAKETGRSAHSIRNKRYTVKQQQKLMKEKKDAKRKQQEPKRIPQKGDKDYYTHMFPDGIKYPGGSKFCYCG